MSRPTQRPTSPRPAANAPRWLRDLFAEAMADDNGPDWWEWLESAAAIAYLPADEVEQWEGLTGRERGRWLLEQLGQCQDRLPMQLSSDLGLPSMSTYAAAVQFLAEDLDLD